MNYTDLPNKSQTQLIIIQQFSIGPGVVLAIGGVNLLLFIRHIKISPENNF